MALKSGRVGVRKDQVDHYGRITAYDEEIVKNHSSIFRGKDISEYVTDGSLYKRINGTDGYELFEDLYVGDYFDIELPVLSLSTAKQNVRCIIADFDYYRRKGDSETTFHHVVIVPKNSFANTAQMEETNITSNGYYGSKMVTDTLPVYQTALENIFGSHMKTFKDILTTSGATSGASMAGAGLTGYANNWAWQSIKMRLMNEVQVYGCTIMSSSFYDVGAANTQLALFRMKPDYIVAMNGGVGETSRSGWWLSAVASSTYFATVTDYGVAVNFGASAAFGVRPLWLLS